MTVLCYTGVQICLKWVAFDNKLEGLYNMKSCGISFS